MSKIEWTGRTWNPVTGCDRISPGCDHCYAMTMAKRLKAMGSEKYQNDGDPRTSGPGFGVAVHQDALTEPLKWRKPSMVFVNSMSDLFHKDIPDEYIAQVFAVMALAERHTFQVLTKRHARMRTRLSSRSFPELVTTWAWRISAGGAMRLQHGNGAYSPTAVKWPLPNVWLGVSAENQHWADIRIPALLDTPAAVRFVSAEPLLGPIELSRKGYIGGQRGHGGQHHGNGSPECPRELHHHHDIRCLPGLDWVIAGGESGPKARPMHPHWVRDLRDDCAEAGAPFFFKQWGEWLHVDWTEASGKDFGVDIFGAEPPARLMNLPRNSGRAPMRRVGKKRAGRELDGRTWDEFPRVASEPPAVPSECGDQSVMPVEVSS